jgi:hypothetical protein
VNRETVKSPRRAFFVQLPSASAIRKR